MKLTILGCGGSNGVPLIGGNWGLCNPKNPRNRRLRASILTHTAEIFSPDQGSQFNHRCVYGHSYQERYCDQHG